MAAENDQMIIYLNKYDFSLSYLENYEKNFQNCRGTSEEHTQGIDCEIRNIEHDIGQWKRQGILAQGFVYRHLELKDNCVDPIACDDFVKILEGYVEFLKEKKKKIVKSTRELYSNEKYLLLETLGLFSTSEWKGIVKSSDKELVLAQLLGCDADYSKDLLNRRHSVKDDRKDTILEMIKEMKKGA